MVDCLQSHLKEHHTGANVQQGFLPVQIKSYQSKCDKLHLYSILKYAEVY